MGQKVNPNGLRLGINKNWDARWYASNKEVPNLLDEDLKIRKYVAKKFQSASIARVITERSKNRVVVTLYTAKPGMVIGREGAIKKEAVEELSKLTGKEVYVNVKEVRRPETDATLVADSIARQLENRASFRRVQKLAITRALKAGAKGCKTSISGRLAGAEIARSEGYSEGNVPLHTLRANIDYAHTEALTTYGVLGVKVWIYKGEVLKGTPEEEDVRREDRRHANAKKN
ncbi:30S ribosomal protein S3 [bacterium]|nr:30S ribosomal protein S3 [bacterium]